MEWIKSLLFFIVILAHYLLIGELLLSFSKYMRAFSNRLLLGFFGSFFLGFVVGVPAQIFQVSWSLYFWIMLTVFVAVDALSIYLNLSKISEFINKSDKDTLKNSVKIFFKNNWVCILFVVLFTAFSMSNESPLHFLNYDDHYYIGKVRNLIETDKLMNENYFNGAIWTGSFAIERVINTFELSYSFLATVFNIYVPFFCRVTMVIHNYIIFVLVYKMVGGLFLEESRAQFVLFAFFLFLLPNGYLNQSFVFKVTSYDLWQFQTAAFYGGSIVRMISLPSLFIFSTPLLKKVEIKKIIVLGMICLVFMSFSTIFLLNFIIFMIVILIVKFVFMIKEAIVQKNKRFMILGCMGLTLMITFLLSTKVLDQINLIDTDTYQNALNWLNSDLAVGFNRDYLYKSSILLIPISFLLCKKEKGRAFIIFIGILFVLCFTMYFKELFVFGSMSYSFVTMRFLASVSYLLLLNIGLVVLMITEQFKNIYIIDSILTIAFSTFMCVYFGVNYEQIRLTPPLLWGSGICDLGWDFSRVFDFNTKMVPDIFVEIGEYFNSLPYGNYNLYIPTLFNLDNELYRAPSIQMTTNRVVTHEAFEPAVFGDKEQMINDYSMYGIGKVEDIVELLKSNKFTYFTVFSESAAKQLAAKGHDMKIQSDLGYYIFKLS